MTTAGNRSRELVQQVLQSMWREIGIEVRIRNEQARVFFGETVSKRKFKGAAMFAWLSSPESVPRTTLRSDQIPTAANAWAGQNYTGFRNDEMDALIDRIEVELDRAERKALWALLQRLYVEELPVIPLYWRRQRLHPTEMAERPASHRPPRHDDAMDRRMAGFQMTDIRSQKSEKKKTDGLCLLTSDI